jgi:hypothetical protein
MKLFGFDEWCRVNESIALNEDFKTQSIKYQNQGYQDDEIKRYLDDFKELRNRKYSELLGTSSEEILQIGARDEITDTRIKNFPIGQDRLNIDKYQMFDDVIAVIDWISGIKKFGFANQVSIEVDGELVFENEKIAIYHANNKQACIKYKGDRTYSWCVSRSDSENAYSGYRNQPDEPSFYFIKRKIATDIEFSKKRKGHELGQFEDEWHFFVIQVLKDKTYTVTSAMNAGDVKMTWDEILAVSPELKGLDQYLKHVPRTPEEKEKYDFFSKIDQRNFPKLSYLDKEYYIDNFSILGLTDISFLSLPKDLRNKYIGLNPKLTGLQFKLVEEDKDLLKRYTEIVNRKWENIIKDEATLNNSDMTEGEYLVLNNKLKPKLFKTLKNTLTSGFSINLLNDNDGSITTLEDFKRKINYLYADVLWINNESPYKNRFLPAPDYLEYSTTITAPNFSMLSRVDFLKKEVDRVLETNPYAKNFIGIYLRLTNNFGNFNNYLKYLDTTAGDFYNGLSEDELYILSQGKIKGEKEGDYKIINPHPGAKGRVDSYYPWFKIKAPGENKWKTFEGGHTNYYYYKPLEEKHFTFEFDEFRYDNIDDFIKDWGLRLVFIKTKSSEDISLGKYLEENPSVIVRVSKDYYVNNDRYFEYLNKPFEK